MRWSKIALLMFGAGLLLGLAAIAADIGWPERPASALMALGIAALPIGMAVDWRRATRTPRPARKQRARAPTRRPGTSARRPARPRRQAPPER
ncbi:MAG: hypothetical protein ACREET_14190 [Stellaceae bacterium]